MVGTPASPGKDHRAIGVPLTLVSSGTLRSVAVIRQRSPEPLSQVDTAICKQVSAPYKRGVTGSNPVAPTRSEGMLGGPVGSRRAKRRVVPLPGQSRWLPLRRHQDAPATAGTEASRHRSGRAARAGGRRRPTISRWGVVARQLPGVRHDDRHHARTAQRQMRLPANHPSGRPVRRVNSRVPRHTFVSTMSAGGQRVVAVPVGAAGSQTGEPN